jgi:hypothetical protein
VELAGPLSDVIDQSLLDIDRVNFSTRGDGVRQRRFEHAGAGADVGNDVAGFQPKPCERFVDL